MANYFVCLVIQRLVLPIILAACCLMRPVGISLPYLLFLFYLPFVPVASMRSMKGHTGYYLTTLLTISIALLIVQIAFQVFYIVLGYELLENCGFLQILLRHIGLVTFDKLSASTVIFWISPEIVTVVSSTVIFILLSKLVVGHLDPPTSPTSLEAPDTSTSRCEYDDTQVNRDNLALSTKLGKILSAAILCVAAVLQPSVSSGIYFIIFLGAATWWGCYKELNRAFAIVLRITLFFLFGHVVCLLAYQNPWPQELLPANGTIPRIFGLTPILTSTCDVNGTDIRIVEFNSDLGYDYYLNPVALLLCYYVIAITSTLLLRPQGLFNRAHRESTTIPNERTPLMRGTTRRVRDANSESQGAQDNIAMHVIDEEESTTSFFEQIMLATGNVASFIYKNSYIFTNVVMMTWSIMYHSWLTFVLLIWANLIWIMPNQRKNMLNSSPFLVIYAELLLLAQYLYGMKLTDDELPISVDINGINLSQIGFIKYREYPCGPLLIKSLFTTMFWISLRQMIQEKESERTASTLSDMAAPLQITVGAATTAASSSSSTKKPIVKSSAFISKAGSLINSFLIKFWIWVVAITLFVSGISGSRMTGFRIVYMALFLIFVLTFQFSFKVWRKFMYGFWLTVIVYSMAILVLVYTYQFDKFALYWVQYLKISDTLQKDIGLEIYETKQLFLHLVNPTLIVIITVIQLHYCHKKFLAISEIPSGQDNEVPVISETSSAYGTFPKKKKLSKTLNEEQSKDTTTGNEEEDISEMLDDLRFRKLSKQEMKTFAAKMLNHAIEFAEIVWLFFEIHLLKIILLVGFALSIHKVSFLHIFFVFMTVFAVKAHTTSLVLITRVMSLISSILLILNMIYQVDYIEAHTYETECMNFTDVKQLNNNAIWFGFEKSDEQSSLTDIIRPYLIYIIVVTIHTVVVLRQTIRRIRLGSPSRAPSVLFPNITRAEADKDIPSMIKYLFNYGFYKFGIEISLMAQIVVVASRMDIFSCFYAIWLCAMFHMTRESIKKIWQIFTWFIVFLIPLQYIILVGLPPLFCPDYPWNIPFLTNFNVWAMLPENTLEFKAQSSKLMADFVLLMFMCRQTLVFRIEHRYSSCPDDFTGGSNKSVLDDIDTLGTVPFLNPTPDFIAKIRNWLDIFKRGVFLVFFWFTLAIVFLTGTSRVNLFSLGYLIGSFTFLWQGTDFYLRPIKAILKWWNILIGYNVFVITTKTLIQLVGCLFLSNFKMQCWFVQLIGITCMSAEQPAPPENPDDIDPDECLVPLDDAGLFWDGVCFSFLLLQRRIFSSHYFCHIINETKASTILASRGAELIEELRIKEVKQEGDRESQILQKIKMKMDRIKATQQRILEPVQEPTTHATAIRSGDYYMFEDVENEFELDLFNTRDSDEDDERKSSTERRLSRKLTLGKFMAKMKENSEKEVVEQEATASSARRSSSPNLNQRQTADTVTQERSVLSEPLPRHTHFEQAAKLKAAKETDQQDGQQPGTSKDTPKKAQTEEEARLISDDDEELDEDAKEKKSKFSLSGLALIPAFISGVIGSLTIRLHRVSRSYRYVMKVLAREKKNLKETPGFGAGMRTGSGMVWTPIQGSSRSGSSRSGSGSGASTSSIKSRNGSPVLGIADDIRTSTPNTPLRHKQKTRSLKEHQGLHQMGGIGPAMAMIAKRDDNAAIMSDAKKTFDEDEDDFASQDHSVIVELLQALWYAILSHTDFICYFMVFLNQITSASVLSIPLPLMVTLWGTLTFPRPSKTFWVTLIAYTQTVVLIKCFCQFEMLWWNQNAVIPNQPFNAARIIGIERKKGYATFDLALLLVVFCHRFILKSLGLWKSDFVEESVSEGYYKVDDTNDKTRNLMTSAELAEKDKTTISIEQDGVELDMVKVDPNIDHFEDHNGVVCMTHKQEEPSDYFPNIISISCKRYCSSIKAFFSQLLDRQARKTADVYGYLFLCDFINFFVILFGFSSFGTQEGDGGVLSYFEENKVPMTFLVMLIIQFFLIVVDRALYLRKNMIGKILFQFFLIIGLHIWMFFILPATTERKFNSTNPPVIYYLIKCFYLLFSAYQIRCGYPARILGNFVTKGFTMLNFTGFRVFMMIPFLFELRTLMDWIWTDTSMTLFDWLKMEDIFTNVYQLKCMRQLETDLPAPRGQKKGLVVKYLMGGGMMLGIIALIWFPLALFAFSNAVGEPNLPFDVSVSLRVGPYEPVYLMSAQDSDIHGLSERQWGKFINPYSKDKTALTFLSNYEPADIAAVRLGANSTSIWNISPPDRVRLLDDLKMNNTLTCRFRYTVSRTSHSKENPGTASEEKSFELGPNDPARYLLAEMLESDSNVTVTLPYLMPKFLKVKNSGVIKPIHQMMPTADTDESEKNYRNITLNLFQTHSNASLPLFWWEVKEYCNDTIYTNMFQTMPYADCQSHLVIYMFNDKIFPSTISSVAAGGIIGIYSTLILFFSRMLRSGVFSGASSKIMFEDLPYVDRVLQLCLDIYLVRESLEFTLEEDLFAKLIFLYRSPETMIKWTRPKNEPGGDDDDSESLSSSTKSNLRKKVE